MVYEIIVCPKSEMMPGIWVIITHKPLLQKKSSLFVERWNVLSKLLQRVFFSLKCVNLKVNNKFGKCNSIHINVYT